MERSLKPDLVVNGVSAASGGDYGKARIDGVGTVEGDLRADEFDCNGMTKIRGNLVAYEADIDGMCTIYGNLAAGKARIDGNARVKGSVKADRLAVNGLFNVHGDCESEDLQVEGAFEVKGMLNAGKLNVVLQGMGKAREIGGESIRVRQRRRGAWSRLVTWVLPRFSPELRAELVEGDDIDLEYTEAEVVRGNRVVIGKGCTIGLVEYRMELIVHPGAKIGKEAKTGG